MTAQGAIFTNAIERAVVRGRLRHNHELLSLDTGDQQWRARGVLGECSESQTSQVYYLLASGCFCEIWIVKIYFFFSKSCNECFWRAVSLEFSLNSLRIGIIFFLSEVRVNHSSKQIKWDKKHIGGEVMILLLNRSQNTLHGSAEKVQSKRRENRKRYFPN